MVTIGTEGGSPISHENILQQLTHQTIQNVPDAIHALSQYPGWIAGSVIVTAAIVGVKRYLTDRREEKAARIEYEEQQRIRRSAFIS